MVSFFFPLKNTNIPHVTNMSYTCHGRPGYNFTKWTQGNLALVLLDVFFVVRCSLFYKSHALACTESFFVFWGHSLCKDFLKLFIFSGVLVEHKHGHVGCVMVVVSPGRWACRRHQAAGGLSPGSAASSCWNFLGQVDKFSEPQSLTCELGMLRAPSRQ